MKKLILTLFVAVLSTMAMSAIEIDTLWYRTMGAGAQAVDFTPDDKYVIAWTNTLEFWEVQQGVREYSIPIDAKSVGDYNYNRQYLVFAKDSTPKLLDWQTKEVVEGFEKAKENIGRIRTAKSKNEFMANTFHEDEDFGDIIGNTIYFYNIDNKTKVDSISFVKQFEKGGFKWKKTIHDYDYCGNNDEFIYIEIDDVNDEIENIPPSERQRNYYVNFYDRETKELLDSVFVFQNTDKFYGGVNKLVVMNDRSKIAWNNKGGVINFFDVYTKKFYDRLVFDVSDFIEATDIEFNKNGQYVAITQVNSCCKYIKIYNASSKDLIYDSYTWSWENVAFSNNDELLISHVNSYLLLFPSHIVNTLVNEPNSNINLMVIPNPTSNNLKIEINSNSFGNYKLSLLDLNGNLISRIKDGILNSSYQSINYDSQVLSSGAYFIRLEIGNKVITKKFIKE